MTFPAAISFFRNSRSSCMYGRENSGSSRAFHEGASRMRAAWSSSVPGLASPDTELAPRFHGAHFAISAVRFITIARSGTEEVHERIQVARSYSGRGCDRRVGARPSAGRHGTVAVHRAG